jgi:tetratricopeptide (TPR) repeat protein
VEQLVARAAVLRRAGNPAGALPLLFEAVHFEPRNGDLHHSVGLTFLEASQPTLAQTAFEQALKLKPCFAEAAWGLGIVREQLGDLAGAINAMRLALEYRPSLAGARFRLARILDEWGQSAEAIETYRKVKPTAAEPNLARIAEAKALLLEGRDGEAEIVVRQTLVLDPKHAVANELMGNLLASNGDFERAQSCFECALAADPDMVGTYYDLVRCRRITQDDVGLIERMRKAARKQNLDPGRRSKLFLAIGKSLDDLGDYAEAMSAFDAAEVERRKKCIFKLREFEKHIAQLIDRFDERMMATAEKIGISDSTPILIVGMPRSGTTLCEQVLSCHGDILGADELTFWGERSAQLRERGLPIPDTAFLKSAAEDYISCLRRVGPHAKRIIDKMPFNFLWLGLVHLALPSATIIHCRRGPADTALSIHQTFFADRLNFPTGGSDLVGYYRAYQRLMAHWRQVLPARCLVDVEYESLTAAPATSIRRMLDAVGLAWDDACLAPERNARIVKTPSKWQVRQPINRAAVGRWRNYEPYLGELARLLPE